MTPDPPIAPGSVDLGHLRRRTPISREWGYDRGTPIDRRIIEAFLARHETDVRGHVLEVGDPAYTRRFGADRVSRSDVLHYREGAYDATIVADLTDADHVPSEQFDCVIATQTLNFIYDVRAAMSTLHRILRPGGVLLATVPGISAIDFNQWSGTWCWTFTRYSATRLASEAFGPGSVDVQAHGNVLLAVAFLEGLAAEELDPEDFAVDDPAYELVLTIRATKDAST